MTLPAAETLSVTESVCPVCLTRLPARRVACGDEVYLEKTCPAHGSFRTILWRGAPDYRAWARPKIPAHPRHPQTVVSAGCPFDCGLCPEHRQQTCTALLEVTQRCNLRCPFCFAQSGGPQPPDPTLTDIEGWYRQLLAAGGPVNLQLSGGEPTMRDDLPQIAALGRSLGFAFIQVNTNGLRLAAEPAYGERLAAAGVSSIFLQFDGVSDDVYRQMRGAPLLARKIAAIERCAELGLGVVLVPTLVPGVNTHQLAGLINMAQRYAPIVRGVHFQPVSYFGRYPHPPADADRLTIPEIIRALETQTGGRLSRDSFKPPGCENALCSFHGNFVLMPNGDLIPWTKHTAGCCPPPTDAAAGAAQARRFVSHQWAGPTVIPLTPVDPGPSLGGWDELLTRARTHTFSISGMAFQDAWNLDLERLLDCCIHTVSPNGRIIPFCAYNLTNQQGAALYRRQTG